MSSVNRTTSFRSINKMMSFRSRRSAGAINSSKSDDTAAANVTVHSDKEVSLCCSSVDSHRDEPVMARDGNTAMRVAPTSAPSVATSSSYDGSSISSMPSAAPSSLASGTTKKKKKKSKKEKTEKKVKINMKAILSEDVQELQQELERTQINHFKLGREFEDLTMERMEMEEKVESQEHIISSLRQQLAAAKCGGGSDVDAGKGDDVVAPAVAPAKKLATIKKERDRYKQENEDLKAMVAKLEVHVTFLAGVAKGNPSEEDCHDTSVTVAARGAGQLHSHEDQAALLAQERERASAAEEQLAVADAKIRELRLGVVELQQALDDKKELQKDVEILQQDLEDCAAEYEEEIAALEGVNARMKEKSQHQADKIMHLEGELMKASRHNDSVTSATASLSSSISTGFLDIEDSSSSSFHETTSGHSHSNDDRFATIKILQMQNETLVQEQRRMRDVEESLVQRNATQIEAYKMLEQAMDDVEARAMKKERELAETIRQQRVSLDTLYNDLAQAKNHARTLEAKFTKLESSQLKHGRYHRLVDELHLIECTFFTTTVETKATGNLREDPGEQSPFGSYNSVKDNTNSRFESDQSPDTNTTRGELSRGHHQADMLASFMMNKKKQEKRAAWLRLGSRLQSLTDTINGATTSNSSFSKEDADDVLLAEDTFDALKEENQDLRSSLVKLQSSYRGAVYKHNLIISKLQSVNEELLHKTAALQEQLQAGEN